MSQEFPKRWLSPDEACEYIGLKKSTLYHLTSNKLIPFYKRTHLLRFKRQDLDAWMEEGRVPTVHEEYPGVRFL